MYSHIKEHVGLEYCAQMPIYLEWYASKTLEWSANINYSISKQLYFYKRRKYTLFNLHIVAWYFIPLKRISKIWAILDTKFSSELKNKQDMCTSKLNACILYTFFYLFDVYKSMTICCIYLCWNRWWCFTGIIVKACYIQPETNCKVFNVLALRNSCFQQK